MDRRYGTDAGSAAARHPAEGSTRRRSKVSLSGGPFACHQGRHGAWHGHLPFVSNADGHSSSVATRSNRRERQGPPSSCSLGAVTTSRRAAPPERRLRVPGTRNLRDVGGYPTAGGRRTRWRTLLRTDALDQLPDASQQTLIDMGLRQVIDLRWPHELADGPSVFATSDRVRYRSIPLLNNELVDGGMAATYRHMLDTRSAQLAAIARAILEPEGLPAVIGCAAGIDRTGVTIAILLSAVGVPADVVAADYALSVDSYADESTASALTDWRGGPVSLDCRPEYMITSLEHLDRSHGGARALLERNGLTPAELDRLSDVLTEPVVEAAGYARRDDGPTSSLAAAGGAS
jgi:hypothetical protein